MSSIYRPINSLIDWLTHWDILISFATLVSCIAYADDITDIESGVWVLSKVTEYILTALQHN